MKNSNGHKTIGELVDEFAEGALQQNDEIRRGLASKRDRGGDRIVEAFGQLINLHGDRGRDALKVLFNHEDPRVRVLAACYLLRHCTDEAMEVLRDAAENGRGLAALGAQYSIKNWNEGKWHLDP